MSTGAALRFDDVRVRYDRSEREAVAGVSLAVEPGELVVVLGPSGCGKSSFMRTVNRIVALHAGRIDLDGHDITRMDVTALRRSIGYVIQAVGLFPHMSVAENIAVVPRISGWDRARIDARVDELLRMVRLEPARYRDRKPRMLSGGEAQRVGVARALAIEPPLLLMDEPFGALDPVVRASLQDELAAIIARTSTTTLLVTHDVDEALRLAKRIVVMHEGRIAQVGKPLELLTHPANTQVTELIGSDDRLRRLSLMTAGDIIGETAAVTAEDEHAASTTTPHTSLRDALNEALREGAARIRVVDDGTEIGRFGLGDVLAAVARAR